MQLAVHQGSVKQPLAEQVENAVDLWPGGRGQRAGLVAGLVGAGQRGGGRRLLGYFGLVRRAGLCGKGVGTHELFQQVRGTRVREGEL